MKDIAKVMWLISIIVIDIVVFAYGYIATKVFGFSMLAILLSATVLSIILTPITWKYIDKME